MPSCHHSGRKKCIGFAAKSFQAHNEPAYTLYKETLNYTCRSQGLQPNFPNTPWATTTFNVGTNVVTIPHLDSANLAFSWCTITTFGNFNPDQRGHLILGDGWALVTWQPVGKVGHLCCAEPHPLLGPLGVCDGLDDGGEVRSGGGGEQERYDM